MYSAANFPEQPDLPQTDLQPQFAAGPWHLTRIGDGRHRNFVQHDDTRDGTGIRTMSSDRGDLVVSYAMQEQLLRCGSPISRTKGSFLFRHGDRVIGAFLIRSGKIQLSLEGVQHAYPPRIVGPGSVVGLPASMAGAPYSLTAEVIEGAELIFVSCEALLECLKQNPPLCFEVMDILSGEISGTRSAIKQASASRPRKE